ncbi:MAG: response regulator transcription factor [Cyclobacteriaceae bacterium]
MSIRIGLVEDNPTLRKRFVDNFKYFNDIELTLIASSGEEFHRKIDSLDSTTMPEIILMDIELPGMSGIEATAQLREVNQEIEVMMFTVFEQTDKIMSALKAGAVGYMLKDESPQKVVAALKELKEGGAPMSKSIARTLVQNIEDSRKDLDEKEIRSKNIELYGLSEKEVQIIQQLVQGKNYHDISELLIISPHTVKTHIKNIYKKMHVHSRASAVKMALDKKIAN